MIKAYKAIIDKEIEGMSIVPFAAQSKLILKHP